MKRKNPFTIDIPMPCTQSWDDMTPVDNGRYCGHCTKKVIDFTKLADHEVVRIMLDSSEPVCGRFGESQLNRDLLAQEKERANALVPALLVSTALAAGIASNAVASHRPTDDIRQIVQRDTTGTPAVPMPDTRNGRDTAISPVDKPGLFSDSARGFNLDRMTGGSTFDINSEEYEEAGVMGFVGPTLPKTKRGRKKIEQQYQMKFAEAVRSGPLRITPPPPAGDEKK